MLKKTQIEIHGHRGARGLFPENTITSFLEAVKLGVHAIEFDVVISKDKKVVVSHEPWMNDLFCSDPNGIAIEKDTETAYNLYEMTYNEIKKFDCGKRGNVNFPSQKAIAEYKPLLSEVVTKIDEYTIQNNITSITYNIEIKSEEKDYNVFQPLPAEFVDIVYNEIQLLGILNRCIIQSFDVHILQELKKKDSQIIISYLVENNNSLNHNIELLGFYPHIYAPEYVLITENLIKDLKQKNIKLITWTVNEFTEATNLINKGVTTIITDYPDRMMNLIHNK